MVLKKENRKGVVLVRYEDGTKHMLKKYIYNRMMESARALKEGLHWDDLK